MGGWGCQPHGLVALNMRLFPVTIAVVYFTFVYGAVSFVDN